MSGLGLCVCGHSQFQHEDGDAKCYGRTSIQRSSYNGFWDQSINDGHPCACVGFTPESEGEPGETVRDYVTDSERAVLEGIRKDEVVCGDCFTVHRPGQECW